MKTNKRNQDQQAKSVSIRNGDQVVITTGKDKGKTGKVIFVDPINGKVVVEGRNMVIKHKKARSAQQKSSREKQPSAIDISNVQILCKCGKATRVGRMKINGVNKRVCVKCKEILDKKYVKAKAKDIAEEEKTEKATEATPSKKPIVRREVKSTADVKVKKPVSSAKPAAGTTHRKMGG